MTDKEKIRYAIGVFNVMRSVFADGSKLANMVDEAIFTLETEKFETKATK